MDSFRKNLISRTKSNQNRLFNRTVRIVKGKQELNLKIQYLESQLEKQKEASETQKKELEHMEKNMNMKSLQYQSEIKQLKQMLKELRQAPNPEKHLMEFSLNQVDKAYSQVLEGIQSFKSQVKQEFHIQQRGIVRNFDTKLSQIYETLQKTRQENIKSVVQVVNNKHNLPKEISVFKGSAEVIQQKNSRLEKENKYLKQEIKAKDAEIQALIQKYIQLKRKYKRDFELVNESESMENGKFKGRVKTPTVARTSRTKTPQSGRYQYVIRSLRHKLQITQRNFRKLQTSYSKELENKTDLEKFLRLCIKDTQIEIKNKKGS